MILHSFRMNSLIILIALFFTITLLPFYIIHAQNIYPVNVWIESTWVHGSKVVFHITSPVSITIPLAFQLDYPPEITTSECQWEEHDWSSQVILWFWNDCFYIHPTTLVEETAGAWQQTKNCGFQFFPYGPIPPNMEVLCSRRIPMPSDEITLLEEEINFKTHLGGGFYLTEPLTLGIPHSLDQPAIITTFNEGQLWDGGDSILYYLNMTIPDSELPTDAVIPLTISFFTSKTPNEVTELPDDEQIWYGEDFIADMMAILSYKSTGLSFYCGEGIRLHYDGSAIWILTSPTAANTMNIHCTLPINIQHLMQNKEFIHGGDTPLIYDETLMVGITIGSYDPIIVNTQIVLEPSKFTAAETIAEQNVSIPTSIIDPTTTGARTYVSHYIKAITTTNPTITIDAFYSESSLTLDSILNNQNGFKFRVYYSTTEHDFTTTQTPSMPDDAIMINFIINPKQTSLTPFYASATLNDIPNHLLFIMFELEITDRNLFRPFQLEYSIDGAVSTWTCAPTLIPVPDSTVIDVVKPTLLGWRTSLHYDRTTSLFQNINATLSNDYSIKFYTGSHEIRSQWAVNQTQCSIATQTDIGTGTMMSTDRLSLTHKIATFGDQTPLLSNTYLHLHANPEYQFDSLLEFNMNDIITIKCLTPLNPNVKPSLDTIVSSAWIEIGDRLLDTVSTFYFDGLDDKLIYPDEEFIQLRQEQFTSLSNQYYKRDLTPKPEGEDLPIEPTGDGQVPQQSQQQQQQQQHQFTSSTTTLPKPQLPSMTTKPMKKVHKKQPTKIIPRSQSSLNLSSTSSSLNKVSKSQFKSTSTSKTTKQMIKNRKTMHISSIQQSPIPQPKHQSTHDMKHRIKFGYNTKPIISNMTRIHNMTLPSPSQFKSATYSPHFNFNNFIPTISLPSTPTLSSIIQQQSTILTNQDSMLNENQLQQWFYNYKFNQESISYPTTIEWNEIDQIDIGIHITIAKLGSITNQEELSILADQIATQLRASYPSGVDPTDALFSTIDPSQFLLDGVWNQFVHGMWFPTEEADFTIKFLDRIASDTIWAEISIPRRYLQSKHLSEYSFYRYTLQNSKEIYLWDFDLLDSGYTIPECYFQWNNTHTEQDYIPACTIPIGAKCFSNANCIEGLCLDGTCIYSGDFSQLLSSATLNDYLLSQTSPTAQFFNNSTITLQLITLFFTLFISTYIIYFQ